MATTLNVDQITADFDRAADVLYLALGSPRPDEGEDGLAFRYGISDNLPSGVSVIGYEQSGWSNQLSDLEIIVGQHLSVGVDEVIAVIRIAESK